MKRWSRRQFATSLATSGMFAASPTWLFAQVAYAPPTTGALDRFGALAEDLGVRAAVVATSSRTLFSQGAVAEPSRIASIRKSILSALYGAAVANGRIRLDSSLRELGVNDYEPLTDQESQATIRDLLQARSGVYMPSSAETPAMKAARPKRGSHEPGAFWYYNNWDFNVLGEIYQRTTGEGLFAAVEHRLARPLAWQDFDPLEHLRWGYDDEHPRFPAYNMWLSARDLARFGQLYLRRGGWEDTQLIPEPWVRESTACYSSTGRTGWRSGYGYMWWLASNADGADPAGLPVGTYTAAGNGGRYVTVFPSMDLVVAIQPDEKRGQAPVRLYAEAGAYTRLLRTLIAI